MSKPRLDILEKHDEIKLWIEEGKNVQDLCDLLNCKYNTLNKYLKLLKLDGITNFHKKGKSLNDFLKSNSYVLNTNKFKYVLIREGLKEHKCERCEQKEWLGERIPIELHHVDGDRSNNTITNLQILCPNCHTLTDNYKSKKISSNKDTVKSYYCRCGNIKNTESKTCIDCYKSSLKTDNKNIKRREEYKNVKEHKVKKKCVCEVCEKEFYFRKKNSANRFCSIECYNTTQSGGIPTKEQLVNDLENIKYFVRIGVKYSVSDNTVRKWCRKYKLI